MKELFRIGHFGIYLFGVTIAIGMLAGLFIMSKEAKRKGMDRERMLDLGLYAIIAAVIGARLYYIVAFNFKYYLQNPIEVFRVTGGGLSIQGGLIAGILMAVWYTRRKGISFWKASDAFAPGIAFGQAIGRIGCDVYGVPMKSIYSWGVTVGSQILHPAQMYEMILNLMLFTYLWKGRGKSKYDGQLFIKYIIGFSINRAIVEFFRTNPVVFGPFTIVHATSLVIIAAAIIVNRIIKRKAGIIQVDMNGDKVRVPVYQYVLIILTGVVGLGIYYFIN